MRRSGGAWAGASMRALRSRPQTPWLGSFVGSGGGGVAGMQLGETGGGGGLGKKTLGAWQAVNDRSMHNHQIVLSPPRIAGHKLRT